ncbi:MAG: hypothetical protein FJ314_07485 [SAR202 cluster bacterium]|nr:hypothetical protein [SAR202 cluster bacterium]
MPRKNPGEAPGRALIFKRGNESLLTYRLKWAAWEWLHSAARCRAIGFEVKLEGPFGRIADVVGVGPGNRVYLVEVKSSRGDLSRDDHTEHDRQRLEARVPRVQEAIRLTAGVLEAAAGHARAERSDDFRADPGYRQALSEHARVVRRSEALRERIATYSTKFHDASYLRVAHCHYIMAPSGLLAPVDLPLMWGLLDETPRVHVEAPVKQVREATAHVLRAIARANTRDMMVARGAVASTEAGEAAP